MKIVSKNTVDFILRDKKVVDYIDIFFWQKFLLNISKFSLSSKIARNKLL